MLRTAERRGDLVGPSSPVQAWALSTLVALDEYRRRQEIVDSVHRSLIASDWAFWAPRLYGPSEVSAADAGALSSTGAAHEQGMSLRFVAPADEDTVSTLSRLLQETDGVQTGGFDLSGQD